MSSLPIIDSKITFDEATAQTADRPAVPKRILNQLSLIDVEYYSFDGLIHRGQIVMNKELINDTVDMFKRILDTRFPISKVVPNAHPEYMHDTKKLVFEDSVTYGFGYRKVKDTKKLSLHAYGRAIDINPLQNPYIRFKDQKKIIFPPTAKWDLSVSGTLHKDLAFIKFIESRGWEWGGHWTKADGVIDYMHLQKRD